ncbi:helix-turn-helix transcriptional regulator [Pseudomonas sp. LRF_L74]|uniref:helix-turn-helix transcriptional regulator n=1 Tax=Pseudomonas sp. LRF_L74 TaxID=3369422 RepID=UPI003F62C209
MPDTWRLPSVNDHSPTDEFGQQCLRTLTHFVPASLAAFYRIDEHLQACDFQLLGMQPPMHAAYLDHYRHLDPLQPVVCIDSALPVVPLSEGMRRQEASRNREYQGFLQRHSVVDVVEIIVRADSRPVAGISLLRDTALGPFRAHELADLLPLHGLLQLAAARVETTQAVALQRLTPRERQIALLLREGASNKVLARELELGLPTIKTHLLNLFRKVGVGSRTELVARLFL